MKEKDYFDYCGNISSRYSPFDFLAVFVKTAEPPVIESEVITQRVKTIGENDDENESKSKSGTELNDDSTQIETAPSFNGTELSAEHEEAKNDEDSKESKAEDDSKDEKYGSADIEEEFLSGKENGPAAVLEKNNFKALILSFVSKIRNFKNKEVSGLKRFVTTVLLLLLVIAVFSGVIFVFFTSINKENKRENLFNKNASAICSNYSLTYGNANYENLYDLYKVEGYRLTGLCFVRELDFDDDGNSELMLTYDKNGKYYNEVWGINEKEVFTLLLSEPAAQKGKNPGSSYSLIYHRNNKYFLAEFNDKDTDKFSLLQLKDGKFSKKYSGEYDDKTGAYTVDGKDDTTSFERIKYSVLKEEKAVLDAENAVNIIDAFTGGEKFEPENKKPTLENAFYQVVSEYNSKYGSAKYSQKDNIAYVDGLASVELIDFDGDGKNELLLVYRKPVKERSETPYGKQVTVEVEKYYCDIYRYNGSKAVLVYSNEGLSNKLNNDYDIYYIIKTGSKKPYYCLNSFSNTDYGSKISAVSAEYKLDKGEFLTTFKASYTTEYGYSKYYIDGEKVDKYRFNFDGYKNPFFDGGEDYNEKLYTVTYVQKKKSEGDSLKEIPKKTERTIQSLNSSYSSDE